MDLPDSEIIPLQRDPLLPAEPCPVRWRRSARARRVSLRIDAARGDVVVTLPNRVGRKHGVALLTEHANWVMQKLAGLAPERPFAPGGTVPIGGVEHAIRHDPSRRGSAFLEDGALVVTGEAEFIARRVRDFLRAEALRRIAAAARPHCEGLGVTPRAIRLKDTRSRWGSCASDRTLAFSWRLILAPDWVLDYVVAHEVAHLREMNHSPRFWALVEQRSQHRHAATAWLRRNGAALQRIG
ncbi:SprT family zinc-dependent metalloprotease [Sediminicoccus sp. KRV36]|uniref:M48 family metallopeptidase n=1 Tax=Sediminicoccus sp. KRV36 TaxID=3133721 RepID=UPI00200D3605|nr:SprT family zinc-dependent metalloprotease [Sediminicoccus rosea]UPY35417.1 M48 family metallopeptidase [Sediminicoccus rosea]